MSGTTWLVVFGSGLALGCAESASSDGNGANTGDDGGTPEIARDDDGADPVGISDDDAPGDDDAADDAARAAPGNDDIRPADDDATEPTQEPIDTPEPTAVGGTTGSSGAGGSSGANGGQSAGTGSVGAPIAGADLLPPERRVPWNPGIPGGIPDRTEICASVTDYGAVGDGQADDAAAIQAALDACPEGQVVHLPAGTYRVTQTIYLLNEAAYAAGDVTS